MPNPAIFLLLRLVAHMVDGSTILILHACNKALRCSGEGVSLLVVGECAGAEALRRGRAGYRAHSSVLSSTSRSASSAARGYLNAYQSSRTALRSRSSTVGPPAIHDWQPSARRHAEHKRTSAVSRSLTISLNELSVSAVPGCLVAASCGRWAPVLTSVATPVAEMSASGSSKYQHRGCGRGARGFKM